MSRFNALQVDEADLRSTSDVFKSAPKPNEDFKSRFASSGRFTSEQLETGADLSAEDTKSTTVEEGAADEDEFDPNDTRSLYDKLKAQKDAKQEEFEEKHKFKNQMDHWRLDEDDAQWEDERIERQQQQQAEAARRTEEGAQFYKLARAAQEHAVKPPPPRIAFGSAAAQSSRKRPAPTSVLPVQLVKQTKPSAPAPLPSRAAEPAETSPSAGAVLPGMDAYSDDDSGEDGA